MLIIFSPNRTLAKICNFVKNLKPTEYFPQEPAKEPQFKKSRKSMNHAGEKRRPRKQPRKMITQTSIGERVCQTLGLKMLRRSVFTHTGAPCDHMAPRMLQLHRYISVSQYHYLFLLRSIVSEFWQPR